MDAAVTSLTDLRGKSPDTLDSTITSTEGQRAVGAYDMISVINTIPAKEIKERGISAVDPLLERGPVHVFVNDRPQYVILDEQAYTELAEAREEAERYRIRESLEDLRVGRVTTHRSVEALMAAIDAEDDGDG